MPLEPDVQKTLVDAVLDAVDEFQLEEITHVATGDRLHEEYVARDLPLRRKIRDLVVILDKDGSLDDLLAELLRRKPMRDDLAELFARLRPGVPSALGGAALTLQHRGVPVAGSSSRAAAPGLQRYVRPNVPLIGAKGWRERLARAERRVCRVEIGIERSGTGFLVGPSVILTNQHVIAGRPVAADGTLAGTLCRFDFAVEADGSYSEGVAVPAVRVLASSPPGAGEFTLNPDVPPPGPAELDYALIELGSPLGESRGWFALPDTAPKPETLGVDRSLLILQHPRHHALMLAMDMAAQTHLVHDGLRLRYSVNTDEGSSGSPCFDIGWTLVALHHLGDPADGTPIFNQGVPAHLIRSALKAGGQDSRLGAPGTGDFDTAAVAVA